MENNVPENVPYYVHEQTCARLERIIKRVWIISIILLLAFVLSNAYWIYYENSFEDVVTVEQDTEEGGNNNFIGIKGKIINGTTESD